MKTIRLTYLALSILLLFTVQVENPWLLLLLVVNAAISICTVKEGDFGTSELDDDYYNPKKL